MDWEVGHNSPGCDRLRSAPTVRLVTWQIGMMGTWGVRQPRHCCRSCGSCAAAVKVGNVVMMMMRRERKTLQAAGEAPFILSTFFFLLFRHSE